MWHSYEWYESGKGQGEMGKLVAQNEAHDMYNIIRKHHTYVLKVAYGIYTYVCVVYLYIHILPCSSAVLFPHLKATHTQIVSG